MPTAIRFHLDESAPLAVALALRERGIDVTSPQAVELIGAGDRDQLRFAASEGRVIFTQDADFLRLHAQTVPHAGIVYCKQGSRTIGQIVRSPSLIREVLTPEEMLGQVEFI